MIRALFDLLITGGMVLLALGIIGYIVAEQKNEKE